MSNRDKKKKKTSPGVFVAIAVILLMSDPALFGSILAIAIAVGIIVCPFIIIHKIRKNNGASAPSAGREPAVSQPRNTFDECPKTFCFHKDKGEHHVRKGKDIDPWDRPDIDIRKYQHRQ